ncbi:hypothetical protein KO489_08185 [Reinekea forsetii]|nr:hypothetical protein [Reinekea forsetii]
MRFINLKYVGLFLASFFTVFLMLENIFQFEASSPFANREKQDYLDKESYDARVELNSELDKNEKAFVDKFADNEQQELTEVSIDEASSRIDLDALDESIFRLSSLADPIGVLPMSDGFKNSVLRFENSLKGYEFSANWLELDWQILILESEFFSKSFESLLNQGVSSGIAVEVSKEFSLAIGAVEEVGREEMACTSDTCIFEISSGYEVSVESTGEFDPETGKEIVWFHHEMLDVFPEKCSPLETNSALTQENLKVLVICSHTL